MSQKNTVKKTWFIDTTTSEELERIANERQVTATTVANEALKYYIDRYYLEHRATMLPDDILEAMRSTVSLLEHRLDNRANQLLSSMAIQMFIVNKLLADNLEISPDGLELYRQQAVEFLKANNRLLNLKDII